MLTELRNAIGGADRILEDKLGQIDKNKKYIMFVDDDIAILSLISIFMQTNNLKNTILSQDVNSAISVIKKLNGGLEHILGVCVVDINYGVMGGNVNDLIEILLSKGIPVIAFSGIADWKQYIIPQYHDKIKYIYKANKDALGDLHSMIIDIVKDSRSLA